MSRLLRRDADDRLADSLSRRLPLWLLLTRWITRRALRGAWWALTHPRTTLLCAALLAWWHWGKVSGWAGPSGVLCGALGGLAALLAASAAARRRVHGLWRRLCIYRREWQPAMVTADSPEPVRVRFGYADDARIRELASAHAGHQNSSPAAA